jgi:molecular chaperone HtpG
MRKFKTESKKLLDLMINSIYTNREIFLRELISNASDAVDKLYLKSLTDPDVQLDKSSLQIKVAFDKDARNITVSDNGIGMDKDELEKNLGTIAHSGSLDFKTDNAEKQGDAVDIIGQFGVGFYSAFMVAKRVRVVSKPYGSDQAASWESDGIEGYTIADAEREGNGTDVILTLKDNTDDERYDEYLNEWTLKRLIKKYSNYVRYPIVMDCDKTREKPKPEDAGDDYKPEYEHYTETETINSMIPIWKRKKSEVTEEEYNEFYKSNFHDYTNPLRVCSFHAEGGLTYDALLFIPSQAPYDLYSRDFKKGLALYSSNVMIMEKCEDLLPDYFGFVRGIVDSPDLSLNISRETLQHDRQLHAIANKVEKKIKSELADMRDKDRETYEKFFQQFGRTLKTGIYTSYGMAKGTIADLLLFYSAKDQKMVTLDEYIAAMPADQKDIYYAAGDSLDRLTKMPVVTSVLDKGYDVLLCTEDIDEFCFQSMNTYAAEADVKDGKENAEHAFKNVAGGDLGLETDEEKEQAEQTAKDNDALFTAMKDALGDEVTKVVVSTRLTDSPAAVTAEGPMSLEMERILSQMPHGEDQQPMKSQRVLEVNTKHPVFEVLKKAQEDGDADKVKAYTNILYNQALLVEGLPIDDPVTYAQQVSALMK